MRMRQRWVTTCSSSARVPSLRALTRSDDPPHAPWLASAAHGASAYRWPRSPKIPPDSFSRRPYGTLASPPATVAGPRQPWYKVLYIQVLIAIALGVLLGYEAPETAKS